MQKFVLRSSPKADDETETEEISVPMSSVVEKKQYKVYEQTQVARHIHFYISKAIGEPGGYTDMIYLISTAGADDTVYIHLNMEGGAIDTGVQIINAMKNSQAKIVTILESTAYSLGTLIFLCGDEMVVNDRCMMMFHNFNGGLIGKGNELVSELAATVNWFSSLAKEIYIPFLTQDELDRILKGEDMWMQSPEIKTRLLKMVEILNQPEPTIEPTKRVKTQRKR